MPLSLRILLFAAGICAIWLSWEWACYFSDALQFSLPPPTKIARCLWEYRDRFLFHTFSTFKEMIGGFVLAFLFAFPLAWLMSEWKTMRLVLQPLFIGIQCTPMFALAPLMVLWFDWSFWAVVVPTALMIFFPLTMNLYRGFVATPQHLLDFFRVHEASSSQIFWKLRLPWAIPYMWAGLRISAAVAGIGAVAGEWAGAQSGLGVFMLERRRAAEIDMMFGALFCLTAMSLSFYLLILMVEKRRCALRRIAAVCLLFLFAGCQSHDSDKTRLVLDWLPNPNHVPLYAGIAKGFFEERGIDLEIKKIQDPGDPIPLLLSKQTDFAVAYSTYTLRAQRRGADIVPVAILIEEPLNGIIYRKDRSIEAVGDLNGKVIGYSLDGSNTRLLRTLLDKNHVIPEGMRNLQFDLVGSLAVGRVDAFYGGYWNIETEQLAMLGIDVDHFTITELGVPPIYELIVVAREEGMLAERFREALRESMAYCLENPDEAFELYVKAHPDKSEAARVWEKRAWLRTLQTLPRSQVFDWERWGRFKEWMQSHGLI